jgi:hypothetical protein
MGRPFKTRSVRSTGRSAATTHGELHMTDGFKSRMKMAEFRPGQNWKWVGKGRVGPTVAFDHQFEAVGEHRTKLDFVVETGGFLDAVFGRVTAIYLGRKLDQTFRGWSSISTTWVRPIIPDRDSGRTEPRKMNRHDATGCHRNRLRGNNHEA